MKEGIEESKPHHNEMFGLPADSDYWITQDAEGNYLIGRRGESEAIKMLDVHPESPDLYRKIRILLYIQYRAEREGNGMVREQVGAETVMVQGESEHLSKSSRLIQDVSCHEAVAFVENPEEVRLRHIRNAELRSGSSGFERFSYAEFKQKCLETGLPALVTNLSEKIYREHGATFTMTHYFIVLDEDPANGDFICFEKMALDEPIRLTSLQKIYDRYPEVVWSIQKIGGDEGDY